jgi:hypothetical protein
MINMFSLYAQTINEIFAMCNYDKYQVLFYLAGILLCCLGVLSIYLLCSMCFEILDCTRDVKTK